MLYLDQAATAIPDLGCLADYINTTVELFGNPSSTAYTIGLEAKKKIEEAREKIAKTINCSNPNEIYFTSGSTEAANWALQGLIPRREERNYAIALTQIEHPCIYNTAMALRAKGVKVEVIDHIVDIDDFCYETNLAHKTPIVCAMYGNNEIGTLENISKVAEDVHRWNGVLIVDCTQSYMHVPIDVKELGADIIFASGHKFGAMRGIGFLYCRQSVALAPLFYGGHQENNKRAGTENTAAIVSMANLAERLSSTIYDRGGKIGEIKAKLSEKLEGIGIKINKFEYDMPQILSITLPEGSMDAASTIAILDTYDIYVAAGSACSTGNSIPSRILTSQLGGNMTVDEAKRTLRITLNEHLTDEDIDEFVGTLAAIL